jgi:hypothetical protein
MIETANGHSELEVHRISGDVDKDSLSSDAALNYAREHRVMVFIVLLLQTFFQITPLFQPRDTLTGIALRYGVDVRDNFQNFHYVSLLTELALGFRD